MLPFQQNLDTNYIFCRRVSLHSKKKKKKKKKKSPGIKIIKSK